MFSSPDIAHIQRLFALALEEDHVTQDATSLAIFEGAEVMSTKLVAREEMVFAGEMVVPLLLKHFSQLRYVQVAKDGQKLAAGDVLGTLQGEVGELLCLERTMLNVLQRLCGVASLTRRYVDAVAGSGATILDTRKTIPGWRCLDKYAVICGGGQNHRMHLADAIMLKDNHIAACGSIEAAIAKALESNSGGAEGPERPGRLPIIVECDTLQQVEAIYTLPITRILLDNMPTNMVKDAVKLVKGMVPLEASGGVNLSTIRDIAATGVDYISVGAITHSAVAVDIGLDTTI